MAVSKAACQRTAAGHRRGGMKPAGTCSRAFSITTALAAPATTLQCDAAEWQQLGRPWCSSAGSNDTPPAGQAYASSSGGGGPCFSPACGAACCSSGSYAAAHTQLLLQRTAASAQQQPYRCWLPSAGFSGPCYFPTLLPFLKALATLRLQRPPADPPCCHACCACCAAGQDQEPRAGLPLLPGSQGVPGGWELLLVLHCLCLQLD